MEYNTGNLNKYMTKNPLKGKMVARLNERILHYVCDGIECCRRNSKDKTIRILDAGCGEGFVSKYLYEHINEDISITGLEYTSEALEIAQSMNTGIEFLQGDIMNMPFDKGTFEIVLCTEVLEHLKDPAGALKELLRVSRNTLILSVPHEPWFCMGNLLVLKNVSRFGNPIDHINHWTYSGFSEFLKGTSNANWHMDKSFPWIIARCDVNEGIS